MATPGNHALQTQSVSEEQLIERLLPHCQIQRYPARTIIIRSGTRQGTLHYIIRGSVYVAMEDHSGRELVLTYLGAGQFFGETGIFSQHDADAHVVARTACETAEIPYSRFIELAMEEPKLLFLIGSQMVTSLRKASRKTVDLAFQDVCGRVRHALHDLCTQPEAVALDEGTQIRITRQEIARIVGCSREMAGRVLKELQVAGELRARGMTIVVFNRAAGG